MLGRELRAIRLRLGLTQQEFAQELGYSREMVSRWENNARKIPVRAARHAKRIVESMKPKQN